MELVLKVDELTTLRTTLGLHDNLGSGNEAKHHSNYDSTDDAKDEWARAMP